MNQPANTGAETARQHLAQGLRRHQAGQLQDAVRDYEAALETDPDNTDALNLLGAAVLALGDAARAVDLGERAVRLDPDFTPARINLGNALQAAGRIEDAVAAFQSAAEAAPDEPAAHTNLASALTAAGRADDALAAAERALALAPGGPMALTNRGHALMALGRAREAAADFQTAAKAAPNDAKAHYNLGAAHLAAGEAGAAFESLLTAAKLNPKNRDTLYNLGNAALAADRHADACAVFQRCLNLDAGDTAAAQNLAAALQASGELGAAVEAFQKLLAAAPESSSAEAAWNLAVALIQAGRWREAWPHYARRFDNSAFTSPKRSFNCPEWRGEPAEGAHILVHAEQGFGDTLMAARYLPLIADPAGRVTLMCHEPLRALLGGVEGVDEVIGFEDGADGPEGPEGAHFHMPLLSAMGVFETAPETVPWDGAYINPPAGPPAGRGAPESLPPPGPGLRVGVAWAGSPTHARDAKRSVPAARFAPFAEIPGVDVVSLQIGAAARDCPAGITDLSPFINDFADTAAVVAELDLVISVDTAAAHLAGAMDKPVWMLAARPRSYFWMAGREDTPWYPRMRILEQPAPGKWDSVFARALKGLRMLAADRAPSSFTRPRA